MRFRVFSVVILLICCGVTSARAAISVSSSETQAQANAYAPLDRSAYFVVDDKPNVSPAVADVSGDWIGTNIGGSDTTWHMTASAHNSTLATLGADSLMLSGAGSFSYQIQTVQGFVDPTSQITLYGPGAAADYQFYFHVDTVASYNLAAQLNDYSALQFFSVPSGTFIFNRIKSGGLPINVGTSGLIVPGDYGVRANASLGAPNLPQGVNNFTSSGSFSSFSFSVQAPEPIDTVIVAFVGSFGSRRLRRVLQ